MTTAPQPTQRQVVQREEPSEFQKLINGSARFRLGPLVTIDKILEFLDKPDIRAMIEHAYRDDSLTDQQRTAKATALVEQARIALDNSDDKAKLLGCTTESFIQTIVGCASLDLCFTKVLGQAHIVRFGRCATLMLGFQGFITLIIRTGVVSSIQVEAIYKGETYKLRSGHPVEHERRLDIDRTDANIVGVYCEARNISGPPTSVILNRQEMEKIRKSSKAKNGPWQYWLGEMWKKSAVRRLQKQLPKGRDEAANQALARALEMDNRDFGLAGKQATESLRQYGRDVAAKGGEIEDSPEGVPEPKPSMQGLAKFMARIAANRKQGDSSLDDEGFVEVVCRDFAGESLADMTTDQVRALGQALKKGVYDWGTGERTPGNLGESDGDTPPI